MIRRNGNIILVGAHITGTNLPGFGAIRAQVGAMATAKREQQTQAMGEQGWQILQKTLKEITIGTERWLFSVELQPATCPANLPRQIPSFGRRPRSVERIVFVPRNIVLQSSVKPFSKKERR